MKVIFNLISIFSDLVARANPSTRKLLLAIYHVLGTLAALVTLNVLKIMETRCETLRDYVNLTFSFRFGPIDIEPFQIKYEILKLMMILNDFKPKVVLEIGTAGGGTLYLFSKVLSNDGLIISIDLPRGSFGGGYPEWKSILYRSFVSATQKIRLLRMDSHDDATVRKVEIILGYRKVDFLFIDGDHTYEGVKKDFEMYSKLAKAGGIVAFHDIVSGEPEIVGGVPRFWDEIKHNFNYIEFVRNSKQSGFGIGVIYV